MKLCGPGIAHKTERGLIDSAWATATLCGRPPPSCWPAATPGETGKDVGVLVGAMVSGVRELIAGVVRDTPFGPCVMLGIGGVFAEALGRRGVPCRPLDGMMPTTSSTLWPTRRFGPVRGEPAGRPAGAGSGAAGPGRPSGKADARIRSIDLNPMIIAHGIPVAVDALIEVDR